MVPVLLFDRYWKNNSLFYENTHFFGHSECSYQYAPSCGSIEFLFSEPNCGCIPKSVSPRRSFKVEGKKKIITLWAAARVLGKLFLRRTFNTGFGAGSSFYKAPLKTR